MNDEQINEVMRRADEIADYAWKEGISDGAYSNAKQDRECRAESRTELEAYLRTIGEPENAFPLNPNAASKWTRLKNLYEAEAIGVVFRTGGRSVGSLVDGRVVWADWLAHPNGSKPESVNAELLEALKDTRHCIGIDRDMLVDCHTNPCTGYLDPDGALAKAEYDDVIDAADAAIARAESAIETPAKVSPCAGHAVQQDADEVIAKRMQEARMKHDADPSTWRSFGALGFKCHACLDTGFLMKPMIAPEPPDVKCPNGCRSKKGGA